MFELLKYLPATHNNFPSEVRAYRAGQFACMKMQRSCSRDSSSDLMLFQDAISELEDCQKMSKLMESAAK
jgi:hypothetical protein